MVNVSWEYVLNHGLSTDACIPYVSDKGDVPACPSTCVNGSEILRTKATKIYPILYESLKYCL
jgi:hypothetical protein